MSKKIIRCSKEGVRESISGNNQELPSSVEFQLDEAAFIENHLDVAVDATGTVVNHSLVSVRPPALVVLPARPTNGMKVTVFVGNSVTEPIGISASHSVTPAGDLGMNFSGSFAKRDFHYTTAWGWNSGGQGADTPDGIVCLGGLTGSYTF